MEIIRRNRVSKKFKVLKANFSLGKGMVPEVGEELEFLDAEGQATALNLIKRGSLIPCDLPAVAEYIAVTSFSLPGKRERFEAKNGDIVELKAEDALRLMFERKVVPKNKTQWSPFVIKERRMADIFEVPQHSSGKVKIDENWIVRK